MKILHIVSTYIPAYRRGGPIASVHNMNKWLAKKGVDVTVYTTDIDIPKGSVRLGEEVNVDGVKVWYFPLTWKTWQYAYGMHRALAESAGNFDIMHITSTFLAASTLGAYYAKKFKVPYLISPRGNLMKEPLSKGVLKRFKKSLYLLLVEKRNLMGAAAIDFTVESEKREYLEQKLPPVRTLVLPNGLEVEHVGRRNDNPQEIKKVFCEQYGLPESARIVLFLGRITWIKGFDTLIPAFANIARKARDAFLVIVGPDEGGYEKTVKKLVAENALHEKAIFTGMLTGKQKENALYAADVFVLPSYSESFGMSAIEAMSLGVPVVVTTRVGIAPDIGKVGAGLVVEKDDRQLADAVLSILGDPSLAQRMGTKGSELVSREFDASRLAEKWIETYNELAYHEQR